MSQVLDTDILYFINQTGEPVDAKYEVEDGRLFLHSRSGTKGSSHARNTDYSKALRLLLQRANQSHMRLQGVWVDSTRSQLLPMNERQVLFPEEADDPPEELFTLISKRMRLVGRPPNAPSGKGNNTKRLRIDFSGNPKINQIIQIIGMGNLNIDFAEKSELFVLADDLTTHILPDPADREWSEGNPYVVTHILRERASGLVMAKKCQVIKEHGNLLCERCGMDPAAVYGESVGDACIEVHHKLPLSAGNNIRKTRLKDLMCVCANCHRIIHREIRDSENS